MNEAKILTCSPSGELQWVTVNNEDVTIKDGVILVKGANTLIADAIIIPNKKNIIGQKKSIEVTPIAYLHNDTMYVAGKYIDLALPQIKEANATIIEIFCDTIQEAEKFFENDGVKVVLNKCANILLEPFIYFFNSEDCSSKGILANNKRGAIILNKYLNKIPDKSIIVYYQAYYTPLYSNLLFPKKILTDNFNKDVTLTELLKNGAIYSYIRDNVLVDRENKLFMVIDTGNEDKKYIAEMMNTKYKDWTLYIFSDDGMYVLPADSDFSKINKEWLKEHFFKDKQWQEEVCGKKIEFDKENKFDLTILSINLLKEIIASLKDSKFGYKLSKYLYFKNNTLYVTDIEVYEAVKDIQIDKINILLCVYNIIATNNYSINDLQGYEKTDNGNSDDGNNINNSTIIIGKVDLNDDDDYQLVLDYFSDETYGIVKIYFDWWHYSDNRRTIITIDKNKRKVIIGDKGKVYSDINGKHAGTAFDYKQLYRIFAFAMDYNYDCNITFTNPLTNGDYIVLYPTDKVLFDTLYYAYLKKILNKFKINSYDLVHDWQGGGHNVPYKYDWDEIERDYSKDFAYKMIELFFPYNDIERMFKYITEYGCFEYQVPNKYYSAIVEKYDKIKSTYEKLLENAKEIANIVKQNIVGFPIVKNYEYYVYNTLFTRGSGAINECVYLFTNCQSLDDGNNFASVGVFSANINTKEISVEGVWITVECKDKNNHKFKPAISDEERFGTYKVYPNKSPIVFSVIEYDENGKQINKYDYSVSDWKIGSSINVADNVTLHISNTKAIGKVYETTSMSDDCEDYNGYMTNNISAFPYTDGIKFETQYCFECMSEGDENYRMYKSATIVSDTYKTKSSSMEKERPKSNLAIFEVHSIEEKEDEWVEVRITPKVKLKDEEQETLANSLIINNGIIPKGEV